MKSQEYIRDLERVETIQEDINTWLKLVDDFSQGNKTDLICSLHPDLSSSLIPYFEIEIPMTTLNQWQEELPQGGYIHAYLAVNEKKPHLYLIDEKSDQQGNFFNIVPNVEQSDFPHGYPLIMGVNGEVVPFPEAYERILRWQKEGENWMQNQPSILKLMNIPVSDFTPNVSSDSNSNQVSVKFYSYLALKIDHEEKAFELITSNLAIHKVPPIQPRLMFDLTMPIPPFGNNDPKSNYQLLIGSEQ